MCKCGCECCKVKKAKGIGIVFNPWTEQERTFNRFVFGDTDRVKPPEKDKGLVVVGSCRVG